MDQDRGAPLGLLEVGRVVRAHGLKGEVVVELVTDRTERMAAGSVLSIAGPGHEVPGGQQSLEVLRAHRLGGPAGSGRAVRERWRVAFAGVGDRTRAEALCSALLLAPPCEDAGTLWVHELIGAEVLDVHGARLGVIAAVEANPASDLLVLDGGGLVPMCFIVDDAPASGRAVVVDIPAGLLD